MYTKDLQTKTTRSLTEIQSGYSGWGTDVYYLHNMEKVDITAIMSIKVILPHSIEILVNWAPTLNKSQIDLLQRMGNRDLINVFLESPEPDTHAVIGNGIIEEIEINYEADKITQALIVIQTPPDQDKNLNFQVWKRIKSSAGSFTSST